MRKNLYMDRLGEKAKFASLNLTKTSIDKKNSVLKYFCKCLEDNSQKILNANKKDMALARSKKISDGMLNRLELNNKKIDKIIKSIKEIIKFKNPLGKILTSWKRPNGLVIKKVSIPIGVIGVIYESRPNVTSDVSALCFKTGNAVILRGGSEAFYSNKTLSQLFRKALKKNKCDENSIQFIEKKNRKNVDYLLSNMKRYVDVIIPRGGKNLVRKVIQKSAVSIIGHYEGLCHVYIDKEADLNMAIKVVINSKMRRTGICGAAETILIDRDSLESHLAPIINALKESGCEIRGDQNC